MVGIISVVIGDHFGGGDHFDGGDHFGGGTALPCETELLLCVVVPFPADSSQSNVVVNGVRQNRHVTF